MEDDNTVVIFSLLALVVCCYCSSSSFLIIGGFLFTKKEEDGGDEDENILPSDFDWNCYQDRYLDLIDKNKSEVEQHYLDTGKSESRAYTCDDITYGLPKPNKGHIWKDGGVSSYDDCRKYAKNKGHIAFGMQTRHHSWYPDKIGDNKGKYGCWGIKDFATDGHTGEVSNIYNGDKNETWQDTHVAGCSNSNKKFISKCQ